MTEERLQKLMARAGLGSRRSCEEVIRSGRVTVNGKVARLGDKADPERDRVEVDGEPLRSPPKSTVVALYKPRYVLSTDAPHPGDERATARSYVALDMRLFPIGRLDVESEGLMLFTNDGDLANRLSHPRYEHEKEYRVLIGGQPDAETLTRWRSGIELEDGKTAPTLVTVLRSDKRTTWLRLVMHEGRKRQIRRVAAELGHPVRKLIRERIGPVRLGRMEPGQWRYLTEQEMSALALIKEQAPRTRRSGRPRHSRSNKGKRR